MINEQKSRAEVCTAYTHFERFVSRFIVSPPTAIYPLTIAKVAIFFDILYIVLSVSLSYL
ncbi:hypothetical protein, partial [Xylanibacter rarus]|uniref:hypothetical protein n=1 Tax=Xylanibacter rarus TaxID=1676614 RepID=UPI000A92EFEF